MPCSSRSSEVSVSFPRPWEPPGRGRGRPIAASAKRSTRNPRIRSLSRLSQRYRPRSSAGNRQLFRGCVLRWEQRLHRPGRLSGGGRFGCFHCWAVGRQTEDQKQSLFLLFNATGWSLNVLSFNFFFFFLMATVFFFFWNQVIHVHGKKLK